MSQQSTADRPKPSTSFTPKAAAVEKEKLNSLETRIRFHLNTLSPKGTPGPGKYDTSHYSLSKKVASQSSQLATLKNSVQRSRFDILD